MRSKKPTPRYRPSSRRSAIMTRTCCSGTRCGTLISRKLAWYKEVAWMDRYRIAALVLAAGLLFAAATDYIPAFIDSEGRVFGLFHLDIYKDALHVASGLWALAAACSRRSAVFFLKVFGTLYFLDGVMGAFTGSGNLDLSIFIAGVRNAPP